jgi:hypothetical protein
MLAREYTVEAIETLARLLKDEKATPAAQVAAATALLDRGWGRPVQQLEVGEAGAFSEMSDDDLDAFIASAVDRMDALGIGVEKPWYVKDVAFDAGKRLLTIAIDFKRGSFPTKAQKGCTRFTIRRRSATGISTSSSTNALSKYARRGSSFRMAG